VPGIWHENYWFARHEAVYRRLASWVRGRVLDAGCGEGYGAELLRSAGAEQVVALDYDPSAVRNVRERYPGIHPLQGNLVEMGLASGAFDVVVSLQTIEHLWDQPRFVAECRRVLTPGGTLVLSTPNRLTFPPGNWYHTRELSAPELAALVGGSVEVRGLRHGPRLREWEAVHGSCVDTQLAGPPETWDTELRSLVRSVGYPDFEWTDDVDSALDLVAVSAVPLRGG
jgi:SAM-dependent methyltransferase